MVNNDSAGPPASEAGPFHTDLETDAIGLLGATIVLRMRGNEDWLAKAGESIAEA